VDASVDQPTTNRDLVIRKRRERVRTSTTHYIVLSIFGVLLSVIIPLPLVLFGIGMSQQSESVAFTTAAATMIGIFVSLFTIRRLLNFPLLRTYAYAALTLAASGAVVASGLKFLRIDFSSPQFFLGMTIMTALFELFLYFRRHREPVDIAVVPGTGALIQLPNNTVFRSITYTQLADVPSGEWNYNSVVADLTANLSAEWQAFLAAAALRGIPVYHFKQLNESFTGRVTLDHLWENTLGAIVPSLIYPQLKRGLDLLGALILIPFIGILLGVCAVLIKLESAGPVIFRQTRVGMGGQPFTVFKLRTMAADHNGSDYTAPDDARVTRLGRLLRQYRLDELPQVINIIRGEMSWIGPRPEAISLAQWYEREVPFYSYRHIVRPGITGWAQVHQGNVGTPDAAKLKLEYDFFYIKNFSFWLDAVIVIKTVRTVAMRFGAC
jgi:lipopolysaccharide/colanic/teichoic acid biosynthesis glycosyltransferase